MKKYVGVTLGVLAGLLVLLSYVSIPDGNLSYQKSEALALKTTSASGETVAVAEAPVVADVRPVTKHAPLPRQVKAIYMTSCVAGTPSFREKLLVVARDTEINSVILDIKDYSGTISFAPTDPAWQPAWQSARCGARDMKELVAQMHEQDLYVIGRITVFQDPFHSVRFPHLAVKKLDGNTIWKDGKGLSFIDVAAKEYWDHIIALAVDSYNLGFDELNFDYVRYPSDGNMRDISFPHTDGSTWPGDKQANLEAFFKYLNEELDKEDKFATHRHIETGRASSTPWTSVDLFGMTTTNYDDLSIGQIQERAAPYFDFVAPMVYPSHYPDDYLGLGDPNLSPYKVVYHAMKTGVERMQATTTRMQGFLHERVGTSTPAVYTKPAYTGDRLRTWIQDFDYGGNYDVAEVRAQIQASYDAGVMSFMIWAPSNIYTKGALKAPGTYELATSSVANARE